MYRKRTYAKTRQTRRTYPIYRAPRNAALKRHENNIHTIIGKSVVTASYYMMLNRSIMGVPQLGAWAQTNFTNDSPHDDITDLTTLYYYMR